jgi:DNA-binding NtrC family response regulator
MHPARILIVEDDPLVSKPLTAWIGRLGYVPVEADTVGKADAALASDTFNLILSDVHLPGNQDLKWVERVLSSDDAPPLVLITGNPELDSTLRAANLPIAGFLVKPPDLDALKLLIHRLVGEHRKRVELRALSREAAWLLTTPEYRDPSDDPLRAKLLQLSQSLAAESTRSLRESANMVGTDYWRTAISETVLILEKTKHSFQSKELGKLRARLQQMLASGQSQQKAP